MTNLPKTWILDFDGTIVKHNGYKLDGEDTLLDGVDDLLLQIQDDDMVIILTSRKKEYESITKDFLKKCNIRYDYIIFEAPYGERILVNDRKTSGLNMAYAVNSDRNKVCSFRIEIDDSI